MMNDKLKTMYAGGGLLKALLKDPEQREMAKGILNKMEMGGKMDYAMGGTMKYRMGGPIKETDMDKIQKRASDELRFEYRGEDYLQQNPEDIENPGELLKYFTVSEAARMLEGDRISTRGSSPDEILMMARKKGFNPLTSARDLFDREIEIRKGRM